MNRTVGRTRLRWLVSHVRALVEAGWGARFRYPGVIVDPDGAPIEVIAVERLLLGADHVLNTVRNSRSSASRSSIENDGLHWPRRDGLKWLHLASVVVGVDVA